MGTGLILVMVAACAYIIYQAARPRDVFRIEVEGGRATIAAGVVLPAFARDVAEICARNQVNRASVRGVVQGKRIVLVFSSSLGPACRQQIRNVWTSTGWKPPLSKPRG